MSFDPNDSYGGRNDYYYKLWHFKHGKWTCYGDLPGQRPIYGIRSRPFQIKLEAPKWGLNAGWHIIHVQSYDYGLHDDHIVWFPTDQTIRRILRLRHVGSRIAEGQYGYREPNYFDDNWELLEESNISFYEYWHGPWYSGDHMLGRGTYQPDFGLIVDSANRDADDHSWEDGEPHEFSHIECWDDGFYSFKEYCPGPNIASSPVIDFTRPWPGTSNGIYGSYFQGYESMPIRNLFFFNPSSRSDNQPWSGATNILSCPTNWMTPFVSSYPIGTQCGIWASNFFFVGISWHSVFIDLSDEIYYLPEPDNYIYFQGPNHWGTLNNIVPGINSLYNSPSLENSIWDWAWDGSCAESNFLTAYVRRISDGSIWRFRNWKPAGDIYTDFPNLTMRPTNPTPGIEYASFFMNGPPIPGNETWNTLMILK